MTDRYDNFPQNIHLTETFETSISKQKTQQKIAQAFHELNRKSFTFEETGSPVMPNCSVIFMFGIAEEGTFNFLNKAEAQKLHETLNSETLKMMDWFCAIRYYKNTQPKKTPLKFDYYLLRLYFDEKNTVQFIVSHDRGPRYISPQGFVEFIVKNVNGTANRKTLKPKTND